MELWQSKKNKTGWCTKKNKDGGLEWEKFPSYDSESAVKRLNPEEQAHNFATSDAEVSDESEITGDEVKMLSDVNDHIVKLKDWVERGQGDIKDTITSLANDADPDLNMVEIDKEFSKRTRETYDDFLANQEVNFKKRKKAYLELNSFRVKNRLQDRAAKYPESVIYHLAIVFVAIAVEAFVNAYFFAQASEIGLLGGWLTASLVSLGNVLVSFATGVYFLRQVNHVSIPRKVIGLSGLVVSLAFLGFLHLSVAHYREILTRSPDAGIMSVLGPLWEHPFGLQDMESILLIGIGVVISGIGLWKGYTLDDSYPGYGDVYRNWQKLDEQMVVSKRNFRYQIGIAYDNAANQVYDIINKLKVGKKNLGKLEGEIEAFFNCCEGYYMQARNGAVTLINIFRNIIQKIYNDLNRFPFSEKLLDGERGLIKLDIENGRKAVQMQFDNQMKRFDKLIEEFPGKQKSFIGRLNNERIDFTSDQNIEKVLEDIEERTRRGEIIFEKSVYSPDIAIEKLEEGV